MSTSAFAETSAQSTVIPPPRVPTWRVLLALARPRQWVKSLVAFSAPAAAGVLLHPRALLHASAAAGLFCVAAAGGYFINDARDAAADRCHPMKKYRPVAAGRIRVGTAACLGAGALVAAVILGFAVAPLLALVLFLYACVTIAYSEWLKHEPIYDLAAIAAGFVLRALAGGVAVAVPFSGWYLIVISAGSVLVVAGKRSSEALALGEAGGDHRLTLAVYSSTFLVYVRATASAVMITAYCVWAFERPVHGVPWSDLSIVPFLLVVLRYVLLIEAGAAAAPEELALRDRHLQGLGVAWVALLALGIYVR